MFSQALNETLTQFKIPAKELSKNSGVAEGIISDFRRGKTLPRIDTIERLINALPQEAKNYMLFKGLLTDLNDNDISSFLHMIAQQIRSSNVKSDSKQELHLVLN